MDKIRTMPPKEYKIYDSSGRLIRIYRKGKVEIYKIRKPT